MRKQESYEAVLSPEIIDEFSEHVRAFLIARKFPKRDITRYSMTVEEILLRYSDRMGFGVPVRLIMGRKLLRWSVSLEIEGEACNVYADEDSEKSFLEGGILKTLNLSPEFHFSGNVNRYSFLISAKSNRPFRSLVIAVLSALAVGSLGFLFPDTVRSSIVEMFLTPLNDSFLSLLKGIAGPMIFLSVAWGIYGIGDAATLRRIGKNLALSFIGSDAFNLAIFGLLCIPLFRLNMSGSMSTASSVSAVVTMILGVVPSDLFSPFINGNTLQIIFLAVCVGIALLFLEQKTTAVARAVEQINYIVLFLTEAISKMVPLFIFIVLLNMIWSDMLSVIAGLGRVILIIAAVIVLFTVCYILYTSVRNRLRPSLLIKKNLSTLIIAFTTASSAAAFGTNLKNSWQSFGIDKKLCSFGVPLGIVTSKSSSALNYFVQVLFFAEVFDVSVSVSWVILAFLSCFVLAIATPPIPGGGLATYAVLFAQMGIPAEALGMAIACETVLDFVITGFNQFNINFILLNLGSKLGLVDRKTLLKEK